jgi:hypothetical protein
MFLLATPHQGATMADTLSPRIGELSSTSSPTSMADIR